MNGEARLLTVKELSRMLGVSESTVWRRVRDRTLPEPMGLGRLRRWRHADIVAFIDASGAVA